MKILDRYLVGQIFGTVIWAVSLLTMILVLGNALRDLLSLLLSHQVPVSYIATVIGYLLPFSLTYSIPWGVLVAVLLVFGRLSSDNELVAFRANGIGMPRICYPVFGLAIMFLGICLWINLYAARSQRLDSARPYSIWQRTIPSRCLAATKSSISFRIERSTLERRMAQRCAISTFLR